MIGVRLEGRLGNHMHQYAFALALSKKLKTRFYISQFISDNLLYQYFELPSNSKWINEKIERFFWKELKYSEVKDFNATNWKEICTDSNATYSGFMQSVLFMDNVLDILNKEFAIKNKWRQIFAKKYSSFFKENKTIVIHLRKGDYQTPHGFGDIILNDISVSNLYIRKCLAQIQNIETYTICFISDDIPYCKQHFSDLQNARFEENNEIVDMQLLMHADICIIGNSSFSWWGAYLNKKTDKKVFYPKYWRGYNLNEWSPHEYICAQLPWIAVHHND